MNNISHEQAKNKHIIIKKTQQSIALLYTISTHYVGIFIYSHNHNGELSIVKQIKTIKNFILFLRHTNGTYKKTSC